MSARSLLWVLAAACLTGCSSQQMNRPCGPGYLNNILVPQGFAGVDFRPSCRRHDRCYESSASRKACDDQFLNDLLRACECSPHPCLCRLKAWQWYWQVRLFGGMGYWESQERRRCGQCGECGGCNSAGSCGSAAGCAQCDACGSGAMYPANVTPQVDGAAAHP